MKPRERRGRRKRPGGALYMLGKEGASHTFPQRWYTAACRKWGDTYIVSSQGNERADVCSIASRCENKSDSTATRQIAPRNENTNATTHLIHSHSSSRVDSGGIRGPLLSRPTVHGQHRQQLPTSADSTPTKAVVFSSLVVSAQQELEEPD